jgi:hypothetical protein
VAQKHQPFDAWTVGPVVETGNATVVMTAGTEDEIVLRNLWFGFLGGPLQPKHGKTHSVEMVLLTPAFVEVAAS